MKSVIDFKHRRVFGVTWSVCSNSYATSESSSFSASSSSSIFSSASFAFTSSSNSTTTVSSFSNTSKSANPSKTSTRPKGKARKTAKKVKVSTRQVHGLIVVIISTRDLVEQAKLITDQREMNITFRSVIR